MKLQPTLTHLQARSSPLAHNLLRLLHHKLHSTQPLLKHHFRDLLGNPIRVFAAAADGGPILRQRGEAEIEAGEGTDPVKVWNVSVTYV